MRKFSSSGHSVYIVYPHERRTNLGTKLKKIDSIYTLGVKTLNVTKTGVIEKGIGQILIENQFKRAIKKYFKNVKFDLILYSTPPITFTNVIKYVRRYNPDSVSYLLLKDIFPQNAVDLGMLTKTGLKSLIYKFFRKKEIDLYNVSDYIGCMSPANVNYVLEHNKWINPSKVEIAPNSYEVKTSSPMNLSDVNEIRKQYNLPVNKPIFVYGGNMGKPQGIPHLIECMNAVKEREDCHFLIVGSGTEYPKLEKWYNTAENIKSISLFKHLPKEDFNKLTSACDVGLIFLDYNFTIPNYPSRLMTYLIERKPVLAVSDPNTDVGYIAQENGYGFWCPSNSINLFVEAVDKMLKSDIKAMGDIGYDYYLNNYTIDHTYNAIISHLEQDV